MCGIISMTLYRRLSPQQKLITLKEAQKNSRSTLRNYDGDMAGLYVLIGKDLNISFRHMGLMLIPTLIAITPVIYVMVELADYYQDMRVLPWHYDWIGSVEILFLLVMLPVSIIIKFAYKIH
ncbi:MAG: hypothetical protein ACN2B6_05995 [Rickettsiales bacterium]